MGLNLGARKCQIWEKNGNFAMSRPPKNGHGSGNPKNGPDTFLWSSVPFRKKPKFPEICPNGKMSGKKTLFRGASYSENPKSVLCLAGHLQSGLPYKAVYNIRSGNQESGLNLGSEGLESGV